MTERILVVDDEAGIVRLCQRMLDKAGYDVLTAISPSEALKILTGERIDLMLTDIRMPIMDGFELIRQAKKIQPDLAVVVMTGFGTVETAIQALQRGVDGLILKPFGRGDELLELIQQTIIDNRQKKDVDRLHVLRPLFDVSRTLFLETSLPDLKLLVMNSISGMLQTFNMAIYEQPETTSKLELVIGRNFPDPCEPLAALCLQALEQNNVMIVNLAEIGSPLLENVGATIIVPVASKHAHYVLAAGRAPSAPVFTDADVETMLILSHQAVGALDNARLYGELRDTIQRVEESRSALVQAEKMAALGRLTASVAHEINNPLQSISNCLHLAIRLDLPQDRRDQYVEMAQNEIARLARTVRSMLDFYRPGKNGMEYWQISAVIQEVLSILNPQIQAKGVQIQFNQGADLPKVYIEKDHIQQVFFNLLLNSIEAMDEQTQKRYIWIDVMDEGEVLAIRVEDSGPGIPEEVRERIFEPFMSSKVNGTGLGLSVSYGIIEAHKGKLELVPSKHEHGACFEIRLPVRN